MSTLNCLPCAAIKRWEDAGASLSNAFKNYVDLCTTLGTNSLNEGTNPEDLAARIDSVLEDVHAVMSEQLPKTTTTLLQTRNKLVSPVFQFPEEVLFEILTNVIFNHSNPDAFEHHPLSMRQSVRLIYDRLHTLRGVCSTWRDIVMVRGALWSVIPMIEGSSSKELGPYQLSLQRAGERPLHLAAAISPATQGSLYGVLYHYGPRFRSINLCIDEFNPEIVGEAIGRLLHHGITGLPTELSIMRYKSYIAASEGNDYEPETTLPTEDEYILPHEDPRRTSFANFLGSLTAFRINGALVHWSDIAFSSRLVELRVENINLGYDDAIEPFLQALSSASELLDLTIIKVKTFRNPNTDLREDISPTVTFPKLRSLFLQGLYFNTLKFLLSIISPGPQRLTLSLESKSININKLMNDGDGNNAPIDIAELWTALGPIQVNKLMMGTKWYAALGGISLERALFRTLLRTMPTLKTLRMDGRVFDRGYQGWSVSGLSRSDDVQSDPQDHLFPALEDIYLTQVFIGDSEAFREMVISHPLRKIVIGGTLRVIRPDGSNSFEPLREDHDLVKWLRKNIPNVRLVDDDYCPPEFYSFQTRWQLW